jgi:hypothetical protein
MSNYSQKGQRAPQHEQNERLPEVGREELGDRLASPAWGEHLKSQTDDSTVSSAADMHKNLTVGVEATLRQRQSKSPHLSQAQHLDIVAKSYDKFLSRSAMAVTRQREQLKTRLSEIEQDIKRELDFKGSNASELRGVLRQMDAEKRQQVIQGAIDSKDGELLAAVLDGAHPALIGITPDQQAAFRTQALHKHAPGILKTEKAIRQADELLGKSIDDAILLSDRITAKALREKYALQQQAAKEAEQNAESVWDSVIG